MHLKMNILQEIINQFSQYYFTKLTLFIVETTTITYGILHYKKLKELRIFFWYLCLDLTLFITSLFLDTLKLFEVEDIHLLNGLINTGVSIMEIIVYFTYFSVRLKNQKQNNLKQVLFIFLIIFLSLILIETNTTGKSFLSKLHSLSTIMFLSILPLGIINIRKMLSDTRIEKLHFDPNFWITIGILYYSAVSIPFYYFRGLFSIEHEIKVMLDSILFYTPFTLNIICILIAFICKKRLKNL
jgi:hypothetical protein